VSFQPHNGTPVFAVGEEHVRGFFNRYFLDGDGDEAKSVRGRREAFRRALERQQDEGRILDVVGQYGKQPRRKNTKNTLRVFFRRIFPSLEEGP
jgi:hypothetical protein